ncbi:bifunctional diaminohydroxyphosphoribosylaminopyrimidine deaminase/5-amino-6-(5-phosphoribosylamino)uracil reductase RibD [Corynebacterium casei]|uniref:bifunctional diaminohydroxyphosphoribosylaminopyrimidine deaminase/5-amino-6-(5-phosphoribosylamino)uracil reductase RibD n=1 Tax=Corynebacterium casei TaxID=160386 RepID=UPI003FD134C9
MDTRPEKAPSAIIDEALRKAMSAGWEVRGTTSPNPPVGAVIVSTSGEIVGTGATQPVGGAHAEVQALADAAGNTEGATAVVTLEPCNHTGRTGPCTSALIEAGIKEVFYLHSDPNPDAAGGAEELREAGISVSQLHTPQGEPDALLPWLKSVQLGRPHVTLKFAQTIDGFTAASDGTSQWITGDLARNHVHEDREHRDAIIVGTGTALTDNPSLTARNSDGTQRENQPRRVVIGRRSLADVGENASNLNSLGFEQYANIDVAMEELFASGARDVLVEGGSGLASGFMNAGLVDWVQVYQAPILLGEGISVLAHPLANTLKDAVRFSRGQVIALGDDLLINYVKTPDSS